MYYDIVHIHNMTNYPDWLWSIRKREHLCSRRMISITFTGYTASGIRRRRSHWS